MNRRSENYLNEAIATKPFQWSHATKSCNEAIATKPCNENIATKSLQRNHCNNAIKSDVVFLHLQLFSIRISWALKQFTFSLVSYYHILAMDTIIIFFFRPVREYCPRSSHRSCNSVGTLDLEQHFSVEIEKNSYYCINVYNTLF